MKIVSRQELMLQPRGTIYMDWQPAVLGELHRFEEPLKHDGRYIDFYYSDITPSVDTNDWLLRLDDNGMCRDGLFDDEQQYLLLDAADIDVICRRLKGEGDAGHDNHCKIE